MALFRKDWIKHLGVDPFEIGWGKENKKLFENIFQKLEKIIKKI
jgi:hypothetical protein